MGLRIFNTFNQWLFTNLANAKYDYPFSESTVKRWIFVKTISSSTYMGSSAIIGLGIYHSVPYSINPFRASTDKIYALIFDNETEVKTSITTIDIRFIIIGTEL